MTNKFVDSVELTGVRETQDGYLTAQAYCARAGCQTYLGDEVGRPELTTVTVYRPEDTVFNSKALGSFSGKPVTIEHPNERVVADNWKKYAVGTIGEEIVRDGEKVRVSLALMDAGAIQQVKDGKRQLSVGYTADLVWGDGVAPDGTPYQARQENIFVDHLAIVKAARGGDQLRIGDSAGNWGACPTTTQINVADNKKEFDMTNTLRTVVVDGLSVQTTDQGAQAIEKLQRQITDAEAKHNTALADKDAKIADKDKELAKKDTEIEELKKKQLSDADIDQRVASRTKLIDNARQIVADFDAAGKSDSDIRKAVVAAKLGDDAVKDKSEAYIDGRFDSLLESVKTEDGGSRVDPLRHVADTGMKVNDSANVGWGDSAFARAGVNLRK